MDKLYTRTVTVVIRDDTTLIHCGDSPRYRSVKIELTDEQAALLRLRENEEISRMIPEPNSRMLAYPA